MDKSRLLKKGFQVLRVLIPVILIWWLLSQVDWRSIWPLMQNISWPLLLVSVTLFSASEVVIAVRWRFLLRFQQIEVPFTKLLGLVFVGIFVSNFLPTTVGGDVVKMVGVAQERKGRAVVVASVVADRLYNLAGMFFLLPLAITLKSVPFFTMEGRSNWLSSAVLLAWLSSWPEIAVRARRTWNAVRTWFISPRCVLAALMFSWLSIGLAFSSFWMVTLALGVSISYWQASAVAMLSYFIALIPIAINGLGVAEGSKVYFLILQGVSLEQSVAAALIIRLVTLFVSLFGGLRLAWGWRGLLSVTDVPIEIQTEEKDQK